ncbi:hypothetical protein COLO4_02968 [Corchorus olitorius]|uniref:Uncharacterized protein n=1 Tax=Corchorus olitorius TaxID=93759 RepID=A0A1R3KZT1_9ROSI|nr:hypothetical protein COLO4_02968 [Corchorus olitorius]
MRCLSERKGMAVRLGAGITYFLSCPLELVPPLDQSILLYGKDSHALTLFYLPFLARGKLKTCTVNPILMNKGSFLFRLGKRGKLQSRCTFYVSFSPGLSTQSRGCQKREQAIRDNVATRRTSLSFEVPNTAI